MLLRTAIKFQERNRSATSGAEKRGIEDEYKFEMNRWADWHTSIRDQALIKKAARMDISLDDLPLIERGEDETPGHWDGYHDTLYYDSRLSLQKAIRERAPLYRKERREIAELYLKIVLGVGSMITGIGGTIIGIIALLKR